MNYWMWQIWSPEHGKNYNYTKNQQIYVLAQSIRSKEAELLLNNGDIIFIYETKTGPIEEKYPKLFCWDDIPVKGNDKLVNFLKNTFNIDFMKFPKIAKINEIDTIILSDGEKSITLKLNLLVRPQIKNEQEASLTIGDGRTAKCWASNEDGKIVLYDFYHSEPSRGGWTTRYIRISLCRF